MELVKGKFHSNKRYSKRYLRKLSSEYDDVTFNQGQGFTAPVTYRNYIRANRSEYYSIPEFFDYSESNFIVEKLWDHQALIKNHIMNLRQGIVASEQRTGKTLPTLDAILHFLSLIDTEEKELVYWIAPKSGVRSVEKELKKWFPHGKHTFEIRGNLTLKLMTYEKWRRDWINHVKLRTVEDWTTFQDYCKFNKEVIPRVCIFDEVHKIKSHKGKQGSMSRMMRPAQETLYGEDFLLIGLSGTPAPKQPSDWWNLIEMVCPGYLRENSPDVLANRLGEFYMDVDEKTGMAWPKLDYWKPEELEAFAEEIEPIVITLWKDDVLDLPPKEHEFIDLQPNDDVKQALRFLERTETGAPLRQKLRQISDGFMYFDEYIPDKNLMERSVEPIPTPKVDQLISDLNMYEKGEFPWQKAGGDRVMITGGYRGTIDIIRKTCLDLGWDVLELTGQGWRTYSTDGSKGSKAKALEWLEEFDRSQPVSRNKKMAIIGHPKSMATGLELSRCSLMIAFSHTDDGESEMQVLDRAHSNNMDKETGFHIRHYCHLKYDRLISESLRDKKHFQSITMSNIQQAIKQDLWGGI